MIGHFSRVVCRPIVAHVPSASIAVSLRRCAPVQSTYEASRALAAATVPPVTSNTTNDALSTIMHPQKATLWSLCGGDCGVLSLVMKKYASATIEPILAWHDITMEELAAQPLASRRVLILDAVLNAPSPRMTSKKTLSHSLSDDSLTAEKRHELLMQRGRQLLLQNVHKSASL